MLPVFMVKEPLAGIYCSHNSRLDGSRRVDWNDMIVFPLVVIESPYGAASQEQINFNVEYARKCVSDALKRGEAPFASHLIYTQAGILDDNNPYERELGISAGLAWGRKADLVAVYVDLGISSGMKQGIEAHENAGIPIEFRSVFDGKTEKSVSKSA